MAKQSSPAGSADADDRQAAFSKGNADVVLGGPLGAEQNAVAAIRKDLADVLNSRHVSFLLGSGCLSERGDEGTELGIPTMAPLAGEFLGLTDPPHAISDEERSELPTRWGPTSNVPSSHKPRSAPSPPPPSPEPGSPG